MKEHFVTKEIAISMEEIGFDEPCICGYNSYGALKHNIAILSPNKDDFVSSDKYDKKINAPTWEQAIYWFCKKDIHIIVVFPQSISGCIGYISTTEFNVIPVAGLRTIWKDRYSFYEQAILKAIELIKSKK